MAGIFHAVCGDDKKRPVGHILRSGILVNIADMPDGIAHRIHERGVPANLIGALIEHRHLVQCHAIVNDLTAAAEQYRGYEHFTGLLALLIRVLAMLILCRRWYRSPALPLNRCGR